MLTGTENNLLRGTLVGLEETLTPKLRIPEIKILFPPVVTVVPIEVFLK